MFVDSHCHLDDSGSLHASRGSLALPRRQAGVTDFIVPGVSPRGLGPALPARGRELRASIPLSAFIPMLRSPVRPSPAGRAPPAAGGGCHR